MAWGTKLFQNLVVLHLILLLEASRENSPWCGGGGSLLMFLARNKQPFCAMSCMKGRHISMIFSAVLTTLLTFFQVALLTLHRKYMCRYALLTSATVFTDQLSLSVMCTPQELAADHPHRRVVDKK